MLPYMLQFFTEFGTHDIRNMISVSEYIVITSYSIHYTKLYEESGRYCQDEC